MEGLRNFGWGEPLNPPTHPPPVGTPLTYINVFIYKCILNSDLRKIRWNASIAFSACCILIFRLRKHLFGQITVILTKLHYQRYGWQFRTLNADELPLFSNTGDRVSTIAQLSDSLQFTIRLADGTTRSAWAKNFCDYNSTHSVISAQCYWLERRLQFLRCGNDMTPS